jgi:uncharacterized protein YcbK (DUF882 family)
MNWDRYKPYFTEAEFRCKHTGKCEMSEEFMDRLLALRLAYGRPMTITSGYRDKTHPTEMGKTTTGTHTQGRACDVAVRGADALRIVELAIRFGFTGIGVKQKGRSRFIHLDDTVSSIRPTIWSY